MQVISDTFGGDTKSKNIIRNLLELTFTQGKRAMKPISTTRYGPTRDDEEFQAKLKNFMDQNSIEVNNIKLHKWDHASGPGKHKRINGEKVCLFPNECRLIPTRYISKTKDDLYNDFKACHPDYYELKDGKLKYVKMSISWFYNMFKVVNGVKGKFWNYITAPKRTCLCPYEEQAKHYLKAIIDNCIKAHENCDCDCPFCSERQCVQKLKSMCEQGDKYYNLMQHVLCDPVEAVQLGDKPVFKLKCMLGKCDNCGFKRSDFYRCRKNQCMNRSEHIQFLRYDKVAK